MTEAEARDVLAEEIARIAPEIPFDDVDPDDDIRDSFEIDSMDMLNLVSALSKRLGIVITDADARNFSSVREAAKYLSHATV